MYKIGSMPHSIPIGYTGETNFRVIEIDMTAWMEKMPAGVPSIVHIRPGETKAQAYIAATTFDSETNILTWEITAGDIGTKEGNGLMQVWLEESENDTVSKRGKSVKVTTEVMDSVNEPDDDPPEAQAAYMEQMTALKVATVEAAEDAEDAKEDAEDAAEQAQQAATDAENVNLHPAYIDSTTKHWMVYDATEHQYTDTEILAEGQDGQDGQDATPDLVTNDYSDLTFPVTKDTLCYHSGLLYYAKQDISTSEEWTAAHWQQTTLEELLSLQKTAIQGLEDQLFCEIDKPYEDDEKENILTDSMRRQGSIEDPTSTTYVTYEVPLEANEAAWIVVLDDALEMTNVYVYRNDNQESFTPANQWTKHASFVSNSVPSTLKFMLNKTSGAAISASEDIFSNVFMYKTEVTKDITNLSNLTQGYYSFSIQNRDGTVNSKNFVDSTKRVIYTIDVNTDSGYQIKPPTGCVVREVIIYNNEKGYVYVQTATLARGVFPITKGFSNGDHIQVLLAKSNANDSLSVSECSSIVVEEVK